MYPLSSNQGGLQHHLMAGHLLKPAHNCCMELIQGKAKVASHCLKDIIKSLYPKEERKEK